MPPLLQLCRLPWLRRFSGGAALLHLLAVVLLSAAPDLHALLHDHAHDEGHHCAITLHRDGSVDTEAAAPVRTGVHHWTLLRQENDRATRKLPPALIAGPWDRGPPESIAL